MNFADVAHFVTAHPIETIAGTVVGALVLWNGAKAAIKRINADLEHQQKLDERVARLPEVTKFIPPEERLRF